jgi:DNA-binding transcriptional ArsR family regulator
LSTKTKVGIRPELLKALGHPHRFHAMHILNQRVASPSELAREVGENEISNMAYHIKVLREADLIELVTTRQVRGATEHFYRATGRAFFSDEEWVRIPAMIRSEIVGMQLEETGRLLSAALESGSFERRPNRHHSLYDAVVDEEGWDEAMAVLEEAMEKLVEIQTRSTERRFGEERQTVPMVISMLGFEKAEEA